MYAFICSTVFAYATNIGPSEEGISKRVLDKQPERKKGSINLKEIRT
jgi:hypothetical protein